MSPYLKVNIKLVLRRTIEFPRTFLCLSDFKNQQHCSDLYIGCYCTYVINKFLNNTYKMLILFYKKLSRYCNKRQNNIHLNLHSLSFPLINCIY